MNDSAFLVHLVDDDDDVRRALAYLLDSVCIASHEHPSARHFLNDYDPQRGAACLVVDLRMPEMSGLELIETVRERGWQLPTLFLSAHGDVPAAVRAMKLGALDFIQKPFNSEAFLASINNARRIAEQQSADAASRRELMRLLHNLSAREAEILRHLLSGSSSKEIGRALGISHRTVDVHRANLMRKMDVHSYGELLMKLPREQLPDGLRPAAAGVPPAAEAQRRS